MVYYLAFPFWFLDVILDTIVLAIRDTTSFFSFWLSSVIHLAKLCVVYVPLPLPWSDTLTQNWCHWDQNILMANVVFWIMFLNRPQPIIAVCRCSNSNVGIRAKFPFVRIPIPPPCTSLSVTKTAKCRYLRNQEWYHRSAGVKTTGKKSEYKN